MAEPGKVAVPRRAAAAIITSLADRSPDVLLVRRSDKLRFMAGHHAFPGGRIDDDEGSEHVEGAPDGDEAIAIHAVAREIFEETGLLCVEGDLPDLEELDRMRRAMLDEKLAFDAILGQHGLRIIAPDFHFAGLWVTPKASPIRFHTRYYLYRHAGPRYERLIEGEISRLDWMEAGQARQNWRTGEIKLPAPVAYALQQVAKYSFPESLGPLRKTTHLEPDTPGRIEHRFGINAIPLRTPTLAPATHTNCITIGEDEVFVVDPGTPYENEQKLLADQLDHLLAGGGRIKAVLLTHAHPDHTGAAEFVREKYAAPIWAHAITADRVDFKIDNHLAEGDVITAEGAPDWQIRCLHTPGHDPGHLCFLEETTRTLVGGDMVAGQGTIVVSIDHGGDMTQYLDSLTRLLDEDFEALLPAHGMSISDPKGKVQEYIDHRLKREAKVQAALDQGLKTLDEIVPIAYDDTPEEMWKWAKHSLKAHLVRLGADVIDAVD